jgi:hypothetical protein
MPSAPPDRTPDLDDGFAGPELDAVWTPAYQTHWTTPDRAAARFEVGSAGLGLRIDADQPLWRPEDAPLRVSAVQSGEFSGPVGSIRGMDRHRPDGLVVRTARPLRLGFAPSRGRVEVAVSASTDPGCMTAAWLRGTESTGSTAGGELCLFELDAEAIGPTGSRARTGLKAFDDPRLTTDMAEVDLPLPADRTHIWSVDWDADRAEIRCAGEVVWTGGPAPDYPLVLFLGLFEVAEPSGRYPKRATFHRVRGWSA